MKQSVARFLVVALAVLCESAFAQRQSASFGDFVALLENGERVEGTSCVLTASGLAGVTSAGARISAALSSVKALHVSRGTKMGDYALLGGVYGLGVGLAAILTVESQGSGKVTYGNIGGLVAAGVVIGAVLGSGQQSWDTVDLDAFRRSLKRDSTDSLSATQIH